LQLTKILALAVFFVTFARAAEKDTADEIFAPTAPVLRIKVELSRENFRSLERDHRKAVPATVRKGNNVYSNVMVHVKGAAGSFRHINDNPSLTLSFGKAKEDPDQRFHGLRKIHLNNSLQDQSQSTYCITSMMFNDAGIPAARVTNARFWLNGRDLGMYVLVEGFTKDFLKRHFNDSKGNFYDGGFLQDINQELERDSGEGEDTRADLKRLLEVSRLPDRTQRWAELQKILDTDRFVDFMVLENFTYDWDGYMAKANNYRIYHDPKTDKMVFIPHGMDQMFWDTQASIWRPETDSIVARAVIETPEGAKLYRERLRPVFAKAFRLEAITNRLDQLTKRNREGAAEVGRRRLNDWEGAVADTRRRIVERWNSIDSQLENEPKPMDFSKPVIVKGWRQQIEMGNARLDQPQLEGKQTLRIAANGQTTGSWRAKVTLDPGKYRFETMAKSKALAALNDPRGRGAGLRISGASQPRKNSLAGDTDWTRLQYDFEVVGVASDVTLVCELRASAGEVWFDASTLKLEKLR
jgi:hypothetical protein